MWKSDFRMPPHEEIILHRSFSRKISNCAIFFIFFEKIRQIEAWNRNITWLTPTGLQFPIDALVVWCPTRSKNLGRSLLQGLYVFHSKLEKIPFSSSQIACFPTQELWSCKDVGKGWRIWARWNFFVKVEVFLEGHKNFTKCSSKFWHYLVT